MSSLYTRTSDSDIQVGVVGLLIELTVMETNELTGVESAVDISDATVKRIFIRKPNKVILQKDAEFSTTGADGKIKYSTIATDLDIRGSYSIQAYVETPTYNGFSTIVSFYVNKNL